MVPTFYAALVMLIGLFGSRTAVLRMQVLCLVLGGTTAILLPALGGSTIVVPAMCLPFVVARAWLESHGTGAMRHMHRAAFWLCCTVAWGLLCTLLIPRLLQGQLEIMTIDHSDGEAGMRLMPLKPVSGNITQSAFAVGSVAMFVSARYLLRHEQRLAAFRDAVITLAWLNCAAAVINLAEFYAGFPPLLKYVRTAYAVFETGEMQGTGVMRIHGTFPETSAFSAFSLTLFGFTFSLWMNHVRPLWTGGAALLLFVFLMFSTSGTAYAGIAIYGCFLSFGLLRRRYAEGRVPRIAFIAACALLALTLAGALLLAEAPVASKIADFFTISVVNKLDSHSGVTRNAWNEQAFRNFVDTYGLGVGIGTARASSYAMVLLSNIGIIGSLMYAMFLFHVLRPTPPGDGDTLDHVSAASRQALLASLSAALVSGASFDRGPAFYLYAAAASLRMRRSVSSLETSEDEYVAREDLSGVARERPLPS